MKEPKLKDPTPTLVPFHQYKLFIFTEKFIKKLEFQESHRKDTVKPDSPSYI